MKTNLEFMDYINKILTQNTVYMWGEYGRKVTNNTINSKMNQYPNHYPKNKVAYLRTLTNKEYYAYDCAGLIKSYWMNNYGQDKVKYIAKYDYDAKDLTLSLASEKGDIKDIPNMPGLLLYMNGHCGIYAGNGIVIECTSNPTISKTQYGKVCKSKLSDRKWLYWTKLKWLQYETKTNESNIYIIKKGDTLTKISKEFNVSIEDVIKKNNIKNKNLIYVNQKLIIPQNKTYTIQKGDTLSSIAIKYNTTWKELWEKNPSIKDPNKIYPNQIIII